MGAGGVKMTALKRAKEKIRRIAKKTLTSKSKLTRKAKEIPIPEAKKEVFGSQEVFIEKAKFSHPEEYRAHRVMPSELPFQYDEDKIVLQVRDVNWIHAYWEIRNSTLDRLRGELRDGFYKARRILRVYDVSHIIFNGQNAHRSFDIGISEHNNNWYLDVASGRSWIVDLGLLLPDGRFILIARSNAVHTPIEGPSWITDEEWMIPDDMFARLYGMGFGLGQSSPVGKAWAERVKKVLFSGAMASPGMASMSSPVKKIKERKFWAWVDCELIVYGATEPDAKVTIQGKPIRLRQDGTFSLRFALPDGKQVIPVKAVSNDNIEERTITPIVTRDTKVSQPILKDA